MKKFFYNMSSGNPKSLVISCIASFIDGVCNIVPVALILDVINTIYLSFAYPNTPLNISRLWFSCAVLIGWMAVQYAASGFAYSKPSLQLMTLRPMAGLPWRNILESFLWVSSAAVTPVISRQ